MSEDSYYRLESVPTFEAIYGKGLISLGGYDAVDEMVAGLTLKDQRLLDIGSGIGGIAHHLAEKYGAVVWGLDVFDWMAEYAKQNAPDAVRDRVIFITYDAQGAIPLPDDSIDLVYSNGTLTNVEDKQGLFAEVARVLQPGGQLCLIDWLAPSDLGKSTEQLAFGDVSHKETVSSYEALLASCGFSDFTFQDLSESYLGYVRDIQARLSDSAHIEQFSAVLSAKMRQQVIDSHEQTAQAIERGQQSSHRILATLLPS